MTSPGGGWPGDADSCRHRVDDGCRQRYDDSCRYQRNRRNTMAKTGKKPQPSGNPTPAQYEILEIVWAAGDSGRSLAEIWQAIQERREVARTTVQNLVDRLVRRDWLARRSSDGAIRFHPTVDQAAADRLLAGDFLEGFFGGREVEAFSSLLGAGSLDGKELARLRGLVDAAITAARKRGSKS
ncbi:MAG: BlaI/MecI/CopY family transcriptional regulator [Planctomycetes bacterium]|nr:BlaI/MecI/CopY family transcriptional regulator [Planctomycetota bacterium]